MTDSETTRDPSDDYVTDDVSVISDTTHGTDEVTSPLTAWAGLKGLMKSLPRKRECLHSPFNKGDCSPIIPSQNRTQNLSGDVQQDDCMSDNESVMSTSLLTVKGRLSKPRDTTPLTHSEDNNHRVNALVLLTSDMSNQPFSQDKTENVTFADEQVHSLSVPTKSLENSKQEEHDEKHYRKAPEVNYTQILDEIFGSKAARPQCGPNIPPAGDFQQKGDSVPTQQSSTECLEISVSEKMGSAFASNSQLSDLLLSEKCVKPSPRQTESDADDPESNHSVINRETKRVMFAPPKVITPSTGDVIPLSNLTQKTYCRSQGQQHGIDKTQIDEMLQGQILTDTVGCKQPPSSHQLPESQMTLKDLPAHDNLVSLPTRENLSINEHSVSQLKREALSFQQHTRNEDDLSTHLEPISKMTMEDLSTYQHPLSQLSMVNLSTHQQPVSQLAQVDLSAHQQPVSQTRVDLSAHQQPVSPLTQGELSTQLLDFIVEFTQVSSTSSGMGPSGSGPERLLESLQEHQNLPSPYDLFPKNESSEKLLLPNQETSSKSMRVANGPNNGPEIGKSSQDEQLFARSKVGKQKPTKFSPPMLSQKNEMRGPGESVHLAPHPCDPAKMESGPWSSSKSTQGLQTKKSDKSQFPANVSMDLHKESSSGTVGDKRLTGSATEKETLVNLMARYQAMERAFQDRPDKSRALELSTELKEIQGAVVQLNEQHKAERGRLSVRVDVKGLSKSSKKQLKKELQELGDRQKHLLQVVHRHKQLNFRLKQVLAGMGTTGTSCSGRESSKDTLGDVKTFPSSRPAAEASTVQADVTDSNGRSRFIEKPSSVPRIYKTDIVDRFHDITAAENGSALFDSSSRKDHAPKVFQRDQNGVSRTYGTIEAKTSNMTDYDDRKKECLDNDMDVLSQYYSDDMEQTQKTDFSGNILISKSHQTCVEDNSVITAINNELLDKADVCNAPRPQIKETEAGVKSVHSSGAADRTASQRSEIEDSQQDLFSQGSSEQEVDRRLVEEIIATQTLSHESDCPDSDSRHVGGRVRQGTEEWVWTEGRTDQRGLKKGEDGMDREVEGRTDSEVEGLVDRGVDRRMGSGVEGRMDSGVEGWMNRGVEGRMDTQADRKTDRHAERRTDSEVDERTEAQTGRRMDRRVSGQINTQNDGRVARHIDDNTAGQGGVSVHMQKDDKLDKKKGADVCEMNWNSATSSGPVNQMKRKAEDSTTPSFEGQNGCETKKIKICTAEQFVESVAGGQAPCKPGISQSESDATKSEVMERETYHQKALSSGNRNTEVESNQSKIASDKKEGFVLSVEKTCSKDVDGSLVPISLKSKDGSLNKPHVIIPENRNGNNDNTTGQVNSLSLSNHGNSGTLSAVGPEGGTSNLMSSANVRSVCSNQKVVICLSPPEQGTEKVKNVSLMSPPHPHQIKNIATPPQKLQSENLPASTFLSPGSTVASSDVFPVSCRELVRRMAERDTREKQSRKDKVLLQKEVHSDYIAIPVGRIEDFCENNQVKDVDDDTQTPMFVQPQVPSAPKPVAVSKMADLTTLVEKGLLTPGKDVLSVRGKGKVFQASLSSKGHIIGSGGEMFRTPTSWCQAVGGAGTVKNMQSYNMVLYKGKPLSSFVVPRESTEFSGQRHLRAQTESQAKPVGSSITRSLKTANKSTSLPRQSSGVSSTTTAANKVQTKSLTYSVTKSLSGATGAVPTKTSSTSTVNRLTGIPYPVPPNWNSDRDLVAKGNKETSASGPSELMRVLSKCTIKLIDDAEIIHCPEIDSTFWMTNFKDIRLSDSLWDSVDCWN